MVLIIAVVVGTLVLAVLVIATLTTSIVVIVCVHRKQKGELEGHYSIIRDCIFDIISHSLLRFQLNRPLHAAKPTV